MQSDWQKSSVGAVATVVTKGTTPTTLGHAFQDAGINFVKVESISTDGRFIREKLVHITPGAHAALARSQLAADDVLFTIAGTIGRTAIVSNDILPANTNQAVAIVRPRTSLVMPRYLRFVLANPAFLRGALSRTVESVQANFSLGELKSAPVLLPPLDEQGAIVGILGALDDRVDLLRETNATLESIAQALFKSWFIDFDPVRAKAEGREPEGMDAATAALFPTELADSPLGPAPSGWKLTTIGELAVRVGMGPFGSNIKVSTFVESGVPVLSGSCVKNTLLEEVDFKFITEQHAVRLAGSVVRAGDIVITHRGTLGQVSLIPRDSAHRTYVLSQSQFFLRGNDDATTPEFLTYFLRSANGQHLLLANASQVGVPSISRPVTNLKSLQLIAPPVEVAKAFSDTVALLHHRIVCCRNQMELLSRLRDSMLPRLVSGKLRLPEAQGQLEEALA